MNANLVKSKEAIKILHGMFFVMTIEQQFAKNIQQQ
jgi:hypothetical protein